MLFKILVIPGAILLVLLIGVVLNAALRRKRIQWLPDRRPWFCLLPKYCMNLELTGSEDSWREEIDARICRLRFELADETDEFLYYKRGSQYADFSAEAVRIAIVVKLPISNPAVLGLQYDSKFGVAFDTGDLWKVADSIRTQLATSETGEE